MFSGRKLKEGSHSCTSLPPGLRKKRPDACQKSLPARYFLFIAIEWGYAYHSVLSCAGRNRK